MCGCGRRFLEKTFADGHKTSEIREGFLPRKFPAIRYIHTARFQSLSPYIYLWRSWQCICLPWKSRWEVYLYGESKKKGVVKSTSGERTAAIDDAFQVSLNGEVYQQTIRTTDCSLLGHRTKCQACTDYRSHIRADVYTFTLFNWPRPH